VLLVSPASGEIRSLENAFSLLFALQVMRSELQVSSIYPNLHATASACFIDVRDFCFVLLARAIDTTKPFCFAACCFRCNLRCEAWRLVGLKRMTVQHLALRKNLSL
jgi:hypothetical protein